MSTFTCGKIFSFKGNDLGEPSLIGAPCIPIEEEILIMCLIKLIIILKAGA